MKKVVPLIISNRLPMNNSPANPQVAPIAVSNAYIGNTLAELSEIHDPAINITICQRSVGYMEKELSSLLEAKVKIRASGTPAEIQQTLLTELQGLNLSAGNVLNDIDHLLGTFQQITQAKEFRVLISTVDSNMCRRFHTDINDLRMLCTYLGKGTLWISEENLDYKELAMQSKEKEFNPDPQHIRYAQAGEVLILKGALYPNGNAVMHRSPAIEDEGGTRLMLRIDTNRSISI